jgi:type I restriction enzyme S subunit
LLSSRAPIGYTAITDIEVAVNQGIAAMVCDGALPTYYTYFWVKENLDTIISHANGSTFLEISKGNFRKIEALLPDTRAARAFSELVAPMFQQIANATKESKTLAAIRDALLPKLISGEVPLKDAQQTSSADLQ